MENLAVAVAANMNNLQHLPFYGDDFMETSFTVFILEMSHKKILLQSNNLL